MTNNKSEEIEVEVIDFTNADKEIELVLSEIDQDNYEIMNYYKNNEFFSNKEQQFKSNINENNQKYSENQQELLKKIEEMAKVEQLIEDNKADLEKLNEGSASNLLDEVMKEVTNSVLGPLGINASEFAEVVGKVERDNNNYENRGKYDRKDYDDEKRKEEFRQKTKIEKDGEIYYQNDYKKNGVLTQQSKNADKSVKNEVDHIKSLDKMHNDKSNYIGGVGKDSIKKMANSDSNYANTDKSTNASKGAKTNDDFANTKQKKGEAKGQSNEQVHNLDRTKMKLADLKSNSGQGIHVAGNLLKDYKNNASSMIVKQAKAVFLLELAKAFIKAFKEAFKEKALKLMEKIKRFAEELWKNIKDVFKRLGSIIMQIFGNTVKNLANQITTHVIGFIKGLAKGFFKSFFILFDSIVSTIKILFGKSSWEEKLKAIAKLGVMTLVGLGIAELVKILPFDEDMKGIITTISMAVAGAIVVYLLDDFNRNQKQTEIEFNKQEIRQKINLLEDEKNDLNNQVAVINQDQSAIVFRNSSFEIALAMTTTGQTVNYFSYAFGNIMKGYIRILDIADEMKENMVEHRRKMESLDYETGVVLDDGKLLDNKLEQLRKQRKGEV